MKNTENTTQNDSKLRVYLGGPIQHVNDYGKGWRNRLKKNHPEIDWVDPLDKYNTMEEAESEWTAEQVVEDDLRMIADCDAILVHWQETPSCGTPMEVFFTQWFPPMADMILNLAWDLAEEHAASKELREAFMHDAVRHHVRRVGLPLVAAELIIGVASNMDVVVQTTVSEPSAWMTYHADAMVETFDEAVGRLKLLEGYKQKA